MEESSKLHLISNSSSDLEVEPSSTTTTIPPPPRFRFSRAHDLALLQTTLSLNPFGASTISESKLIWEAVAQSLRTSELGMAVTERSCKDRVKLLGDKLLFNTSTTNEAEDNTTTKPSASAQAQQQLLTIESIPFLIQLREAQPEILRKVPPPADQKPCNDNKPHHPNALQHGGDGALRFKRFNFNANLKYDLALLEQVQTLNPMAATTLTESKIIWDQIAENLRNSELGMAVTGRSVRDRTLRLQKQVQQLQQDNTDSQQNSMMNSAEAVFEPPECPESLEDPLLEIQQHQEQEQDQDWTVNQFEDSSVFDMENIEPSSPNVGYVNGVGVGNNNQDDDESLHHQRNVDKKLDQLELRVKEIEKHLNIIFGLLNSKSTEAPLPPTLAQPFSSKYIPDQPRVHYQQRQIINTNNTPIPAAYKQNKVQNTRNVNHSNNLNKLDLSPIVKIQKLPPSVVPGVVCVPVAVAVPSLTPESGNTELAMTRSQGIKSQPELPQSTDQITTTLSIKVEHEDEIEEEENPAKDDDYEHESDPDSTPNNMDQEDPIPKIADSTPQGLTCPLCPKKHYSTSAQLRKHLLIHQILNLEATRPKVPPPAANKHTKLPQLSSNKLKLLEHAAFLKHRSLHLHSRAFHKCCSCTKLFPSQRKLRAHIKSAHQPEKSSILQQVRPRPTFDCSQCTKSFPTKSGLNSHITQTHRHVTRSFPCPTCGKTFKRPEYLAEHEEIHSEVRKYACKYCDSTFRQRKGLVIHTQRHLVNLKGKAQCALCGQLFVSKNNLNKHIQLIHQKLRPYGCQECGKRFKTRTNLKYHIRTHGNPKSKKRGLNRDLEEEEGLGVGIKIKRVGGVSKIRQIEAGEFVKGYKGQWARATSTTTTTTTTTTTALEAELLPTYNTSSSTSTSNKEETQSH